MGGTEVYVTTLAKELLARGVQVVIAASSETSGSYFYGDIPVRRFAIRQQVSDLRELYGEGWELAANEFANILDEEQPDVVHFHAFTSNVSLRLVRAAKARNLPVIYTYHTPTATCQRGTMMRWGTAPCDGLMNLHDCARCTLEGLLQRGVGRWKMGDGNQKAESRKQKAEGRSQESGVRRILAHMVGSLPSAFGFQLGRLGFRGGAWTALRMTELMKLRHATTRAWLAEVDHVVAMCEWVRQVLLRNGVPETKMTLCRQGISVKAENRKQPGGVVEDFTGQGRLHGPRKSDTGNAETLKTEIRKSENRHLEAPHLGALPSAERGRRQQLSTFNSQPSTLRICFLGRLDPAKGVHILIQALRALPQASLRLDVYGIPQGKGGIEYAATLRRKAEGDPRIGFHNPVPAESVISLLSNYHLLAVPSQGLETGPLVVLEAFAAGIPVMGSRLGGIAELVKDGENGILVQANSIEAWAAALARLSREPELLKTLRLGIQPPRLIGDVADEMLALYNSIATLRPHTRNQLARKA
jgi:glycosyltransferase involved in cell wall biosynthesis